MTNNNHIKFVKLLKEFVKDFKVVEKTFMVEIEVAKKARELLALLKEK